MQCWLRESANFDLELQIHRLQCDIEMCIRDRPEDVKVFDGFQTMDEEHLKALYDSLGLAMTFRDFCHIQNYFAGEEHRDPTMTEIRVLDTYWSDHCRHTTFLSLIHI